MSDLIIRISGNIDDFDKALDEAQGKTEGLSGKLESIAKASAVAFAALTAEVVLSAKAFGEAESVQNRLNQAMQNQGIYSKALEKKYSDLASSLQTLTGIDDEHIKSAIATTQSMIGQQEVTSDLTKAILDLSIGKKMDLEATAELISKGINGHTAALKKAGIAIDENLSREERMAKIIEIVNQQYGGQAAAQNKGIGSLKGLTAAFGDLQEEIGKRFAPIIEIAIKKATEFVVAIQQNEALIDFAAALIAGGIAVTGFIGTLATLGVAFASLNALVTALGISMAAALGPIGLVAAGVAAAAGAIGYYASQQIKATDGAGELEKKLSSLNAELTKLQAEASKPGIENEAGWAGALQKSIARTKAEIEDTEEKLRRLQSLQGSQSGAEQDPAKAAAAKKAADEVAAAETRKRERITAENQLILLEAGKASEQQIALKKQEVEVLKQIEDEKNKSIRDSLVARIADIRALEDEQRFADVEKQQTFNAQVLANNEEFQALSKQQQQVFLLENGATLQSQLDTEATARRNAAKQKAVEQVDQNNQFLANQQKFGTAYAGIYSVMHSEIFKGTKSAFGEMAEFQQSSNSTLKGIGKAAAVANIIIKTAESAMNIYAGFSVIPFIGPALGVAGAAAAIAFGAEQIGKITAAAQGGLITGGIPGVDSVPVMAQHGELVAPTSNFDEVIGSVRAAREAEKVGSNLFSNSEQSGNGVATVVLELKDHLVEFVEAKIIERQRMKISLLPDFV
mgnify:CR=1 FL=1